MAGPRAVKDLSAVFVVRGASTGRSHTKLQAGRTRGRPDRCGSSVESVEIGASRTDEVPNLGANSPNWQSRGFEQNPTPSQRGLLPGNS